MSGCCGGDSNPISCHETSHRGFAEGAQINIKPLNIEDRPPLHVDSIMMKLIIVGDSGVGKSCLMERYTKGTFDIEKSPTVGVEFAYRYHLVTSPGSLKTMSIKLQLWDTVRII